MKGLKDVSANRLLLLSTLFLLSFALAAGVVQAQQPAPGAGAAGGAAGQGRAGQPPAPPKNLQVLPKDISRQDLTAAMRAFTEALGVQCTHCHVTEPARDFASDEKQTKKTARMMMQMTTHVNEMIGSGVGKPAAEVTRVQCGTCHRGKAIPEPFVAPPRRGAAGPRAVTGPQAARLRCGDQPESVPLVSRDDRRAVVAAAGGDRGPHQPRRRCPAGSRAASHSRARLASHSTPWTPSVVSTISSSAPSVRSATCTSTCAREPTTLVSAWRIGWVFEHGSVRSTDRARASTAAHESSLVSCSASPPAERVQATVADMCDRQHVPAHERGDDRRPHAGVAQATRPRPRRPACSPPAPRCEAGWPRSDTTSS